MQVVWKREKKELRGKEKYKKDWMVQKKKCWKDEKKKIMKKNYKNKDKKEREKNRWEIKKQVGYMKRK